MVSLLATDAARQTSTMSTVTDNHVI